MRLAHTHRRGQLRLHCQPKGFHLARAGRNRRTVWCWETPTAGYEKCRLADTTPLPFGKTRGKFPTWETVVNRVIYGHVWKERHRRRGLGN